MIEEKDLLHVRDELIEDIRKELTFDFEQKNKELRDEFISNIRDLQVKIDDLNDQIDALCEYSGVELTYNEYSVKPKQEK